MTKPSALVLCGLAAVLSVITSGAPAATRENPEERAFNLVVGREISDEVAEEIEVAPPFIPAIEPGTLDLTLTLGYFNMEKSLLKYPSIIYLSTSEFFFYGDVELKNETGFNPILRLGYTLTPWLALEAQTGVTFAQYQGTITAPRKVKVIGQPIPEEAELGEFDEERRSSFIWNSNLNALWYPLNLGGDGRGRFHPYLIGGAGWALYDIDSQYLDKPASGLNLNAGLGFSLIADRLVTIRAELVYNHHEIQFEPAELFDERDQGTVQIPVYEFDQVGQFATVTEFPKQTLGGWAIQVGFSARF